MLRVKDVPPEELSEVVRVAGELYDRESTEKRERRATVDAAAEMGIPEEYMERAAAEVHARRVAEVKTRRSRRTATVAALAALAGLGGGAYVLTRHSAAPSPPLTASAPLVETFDAPLAQSVTLENNPGSEAALTQQTDASNGVAVVRVSRFAPDARGKFFVNLDTVSGSKDLRGRQNVSFDVRGRGLPYVRLFLENGDERWRSPAMPVSAAWTAHRLPLSQFEYQTRDGASGAWRVRRYRAPGTVQRVSFKLGEYVNDARARGEVALDDLRFE
jgi:hypothetical protein